MQLPYEMQQNTEPLKLHLFLNGRRKLVCFNTSKAQSLHSPTRHSLPHNCHPPFDGTAVLSSHIKPPFLSVTQILNWNLHICSLTKSVSSTFSFLYRFKHFFILLTNIIQKSCPPCLGYACHVCSWVSVSSYEPSLDRKSSRSFLSSASFL